MCHASYCRRASTNLYSLSISKQHHFNGLKYATAPNIRNNVRKLFGIIQTKWKNCIWLSPPAIGTTVTHICVHALQHVLAHIAMDHELYYACDSKAHYRSKFQNESKICAKYKFQTLVLFRSSRPDASLNLKLEMLNSSK